MTEIIPAIIPKDFEEIKEKAGFVKELVSYIQIDIMDGSMTPHKSWPYIRTSQKNDFDKLRNEDEGLPFWQDVNFEVDLMVNDAEEPALEWISVGATRVVFHIEAKVDIIGFLKKIENIQSDIFKTEIGLAIGIETPNEELYPFIEKVDFIQFMGIKNIGFQGEVFDERVLEKIKDLRNRYPQIIISVDGGVDLENAQSLISAGANRLISGSTIFESDSIRDTIKSFKSFK